MSERELQHILIVGGGSAGWLTAAVIAAEHAAHPGARVRVTLLESPDVAPIGVGEGTWPSMRDTLARIGVSETEFVRECDVSFKQGSRFNSWVDGSEDDHYFHPFVVPHGYGETNLAARWRQQHANVPFADLVSVQPALCLSGKAPKQASTPEFAAVSNYGYHLDAGKFGLFLRRHCTERLGVDWVVDHVDAVQPAADGDIAALLTRRGGPIAADLFIDCTGSQSLLLGQHYGVEFLSQQHILFNDSALALQLPYPTEHSPIASQTISTAQANGWIWDIGLPTRRGVGYVYSSAHSDDEQAERVLQAYVRRTSPGQEVPTPRKLTFQPGYRARFWHRNCVAIGQSAGFIEPLEASALAMVELSAATLADALPANRAAMDIAARRFNDAFSYRWERVIDFLKLHYVLSRRDDTRYWRDNRRAGTIPPRLKELLTLWRHQPPSRYDLHRIEEVFPAASYQYILYGMGFETDYGSVPRGSDRPGLADACFRDTQALAHKMLAGLPDNRSLIAHIKRHGLAPLPPHPNSQPHYQTSLSS